MLQPRLNFDSQYWINIELWINFKALLYIGMSMFIQSLISSLDSCSVIQLSLNCKSKPDDKWSYKRSPDSRSQYNPDFWPGIATIMKLEMMFIKHYAPNPLLVKN